MKKILLIGLILLSVQIFAQENNGTSTPANDGKEKIAQTVEALKVAFVTKQLNLKPEEAQKFWPVYNGYSTELKKAKADFKQDDVAYEEKKVGIMKRYKEEFKKVLNNDSRVNQCFKAEPEFHKLLKAEWIRRQGIRIQNRQLENNMGASGFKQKQNGGENKGAGMRRPPLGGGRQPRG